MLRRHGTPPVRVNAAVARALLVGLLALLAIAPSARALDQSVPPAPLEPADGAALPTRTAPLFRVQAQPDDGYLWLHVSHSPVTDSTGVIGDDAELEPLYASPQGGGVFQAQPQFFDYSEFWMNQPGTYWWQVYRISYANGNDGTVEGPVRSFTLVAPAPPPTTPPPTSPPPPTPRTFPDLSVTAIPRWVAPYRRNRGFVVSSARLPAGVELDRWTALVAASSQRWGLHDEGVVSSVQRFGDYVDQVGFNRGLPRGALGVTTATILRRYKLVRVCGRLRCRYVRRVVSQQLIDRDVAIDAWTPWQEGPAHPTGRQRDLQSVVIHELGHVAGNAHRPYCVNSPMIVSLAAGEWWRSESDYHWIGCGRGARAAGPGPAFDDRTIYVDVPATAGRRAVAARLAKVAFRR